MMASINIGIAISIISGAIIGGLVALSMATFYEKHRLKKEKETAEKLKQFGKDERFPF